MANIVQATNLSVEISWRIAHLEVIEKNNYMDFRLFLGV